MQSFAEGLTHEILEKVGHVDGQARCVVGACGQVGGAQREDEAGELDSRPVVDVQSSPGDTLHRILETLQNVTAQTYRPNQIPGA